MSTQWALIKQVKKVPKFKSPILIEGLPGIGNVGKIALDFILEEVKATKIYDIASNTYPHSVFITENNMIELPSIGIYHKRIKGKDFLFLSGDIQPTTEIASYDFANFMLDFLKKSGGKKVVTLGGIALNTVPAKPKVYCTGNDATFLKQFVKNAKVETQLYGVVGPIVGVSGLLLGLATQRKQAGVTLLAETFGHPMYLGMKGARAILDALEKQFKLGINIKSFDEEIKQIELEKRKKAREIQKIQKSSDKAGATFQEDMSYIG